jgi:Spy/CpxP family protein refolding chaperone
MLNKQDATQKGWFRTGNRKVVALLTGAAIVVGGAFGAQALTNSKTYEHMRLAVAFKAGGHGGEHRPFADLSEAEIEARIERMVKHVAIEIDATLEQQEEITGLVKAVALELRPLRDRMHATGKDLRDLLMADVVDRVALENLRAERLAEAEQISKTLVNAFADVAEVLSPEQRAVLDERIEEFRSMGRGHHRG